MRLLFLLGLVVPSTLGFSCSNIQNCYDCDSLLDSNGKQQCAWCENSGSCVPKIGLECVLGTGNKITDRTDCPLPIQEGFQYNETLSKKMMVISGAAYTSNPQVCLTRAAPDVQVLKQITLKCDFMDNTCSAYSAISTRDKAIVLSFRGTIGDLQLLMEAEYAVFQTKVQLVGGGDICKYFNDAFYALWNGGVLTELNRIVQLYPTYELWITGHSMGAAIAAVASDVIAATKAFPAERIKLITFGEPRVGDRNFMVAHDNLLPYKYRVTHGRDIVTHIPPKDLLGYYHHRYEVWYDNDMKEGDPYVLCLSPEDKSCSDKNLVELSAMDHRFYFQIDVQDLIDNGCKP